jgi:hypothetical protein
MAVVGAGAAADTVNAKAAHKRALQSECFADTVTL